ncbi:hypothetical protein KP509_09G094000 [Ceratopteris richardii]|uniref:Uncharacterized protein n=1 Tax=Ceratopteris richardii TaxID=49495 RepID=A0A8T2U2I0_CERRI|nr:hypothetical protein KP509_09G094000 [Ceratopteris richardii]
MGLPDVPPAPSGTCNALKRTHVELQEPAFASLYPSRPAKRSAVSAASVLPHVSVLRDLESSLASVVSDDDDDHSPEELVAEMMNSLQSAIGDVGGLPSVSSFLPHGPGRSIDGPPPPRATQIVGEEGGPALPFNSDAFPHVDTSEPLFVSRGFPSTCLNESEPAVPSTAITNHAFCDREDSADSTVDATQSCSLEGLAQSAEVLRFSMADHDDGGCESLQEVALGCSDSDLRAESPDDLLNEGEVLTSYEASRGSGVLTEADGGRDREELDTIRRLLDVADDEVGSVKARIGEWSDWFDEGYDLQQIPLSPYADEDSLTTTTTDNAELFLLNSYL